jgi:cytochrome P450
VLPIDLDDPGVLLRADVLDDPVAFYETLRREAPVWRIPGQDTYLVSSPSLVREVVRRTDDFSSNLVSLVHDDGSGRPVPFAMAPFRDPINVLSTADPPDHTAHRALLQPALSPAALAALEPKVHAIVEEQFAAMLVRGGGDLVANFSEVVPARTICTIIGIPEAETPTIIDLVAGTGALLDGVTDPDGMVSAMRRAGDLYAFVSDQLRRALERSPDERTGLLAVLGAGIADGTFTVNDVHSVLMTLVSAGSDTTASLLATATERLARDQELQARLRRDPSGLPDAIDDILRSDGPFQFHYRFVPHDTVLGDVAIPANSRVMVMWAAANLPEPGAPVVGDRPPPHFAFGRGIHFCIGAPVARLEARIGLEHMLATTAAIRLDADRPPTRRPSIFMRRHRTLDLEIDPA